MREDLSKSGFSALNRQQILTSAKTLKFDLCVIGGGVTGCGIALDAASRGLKTILLEKGDFASGTSSKSTKLIHGGLRYLKQLEFKLVHESGTERAVVHKLVPHLVRPEKMLLPLIRGGTFGKFSTSLGLRVYDFLAEVEKGDRRKMLSARETMFKEPLLDKKRVVGGGYYAEYRTDDARLTIELIKKAVELGGRALNYCQVDDFHYENERISGVKCTDNLTGADVRIHATKVVSAAGPWVDDIRKINNSVGQKRLHLTKGVHLVVPLEKIPIKQSIYFDAPDGRMIFAIPRGKIVYFGTTDTDYIGDKDRIVVTVQDRNYLLKAVNSLFPSVKLTKDDIISNWAGLRPLIHEEGKSPSELSRKDEIFESPDGLVSIAGGKLTGYRKMAEKVVDLIIESDFPNIRDKESYTDQVSLCGDCIGDNDQVDQYIEEMKKRVEGLGLDSYYGTYLVTTYGRQSEVILKKMSDFEGYNPQITLILAESWFAIHKEMAVRIDDFFVRRTGRLLFDIESVASTRKEVVKYFSNELSWTQTRRMEEENRLDAVIYDACHYYESELTEGTRVQIS